MTATLRYSVIVFPLVIIGFLFSNAQAEEQVWTPEPISTPTPVRSLRLVANFGFTYGGETVIKTYDTNGGQASIKMGSIAQMGVGVRWQLPSIPIALSATANYHTDSVSAANGSASFERYPIELITYYTGIPDTQIGLGVRKALSPHASYSVDSSTDETLTFTPKPAAILEAGIKVAPNAWVNVRYVNEGYVVKSYTANSNAMPGSGKTIDGSHFGVNVSFLF